MSLLFMDGFEAADTLLKWPLNSGNATNSATTRFGVGKSLNFPGGNQYCTKFFTASSQIFIGMAVSNLGVGGYDIGFISLYTDAGATKQLSIGANANGAISLLRGGTRIGVSAAGGIVSSGWHYIELSATIDPTVGTAVVRLDGTTIINFSGNTKNGGTSANIDSLGLTNAATFNPYFDDVYVCNNLGTTNNTFLGDVRVQTIFPRAAGSSTQFTPTGSASNYLNVNDVPDSLSTYNSTSTVGQRDTYLMDPLLASTGTIFGVQDSLHAFKSDAGAAAIKAALKSSGVVYYDPTNNLSTSSSWYGAVREVDPATSAGWTTAGVNAIEFGAEAA